MFATIFLPVLTFFLVGVIILIGPYIKKVTNCWYFWVILGIGLLVYVIAMRFGQAWSDLNRYLTTGQTDNHDWIISKGLLLDICPFTCLALLFSIVVDPTRKTSQVIAPFAIFGGLITICALDVGGESPEMTAQYIFVGITPNNLYFMMHFIMVIVGTLVLVSTPRLKTHSFFKKKQIWQKLNISNVILGACYAGLYYMYVGICMNTLHVTTNVSGLNLNDWDPMVGGEYSGVANALNISAAEAAAIGFVASIISITLLIFAFSGLQQVSKYYWNNTFNKKSWYLAKTYLI